MSECVSESMNEKSRADGAWNSQLLQPSLLGHPQGGARESDLLITSQVKLLRLIRNSGRREEGQVRKCCHRKRKTLGEHKTNSFCRAASVEFGKLPGGRSMTLHQNSF